MKTGLLASFLAFPLCAIEPDATDQARLLAAVRFPEIHLNSGFILAVDGCHSPDEVLHWKQEISVLTKNLSGDDDDADRYSMLGKLYSQLGDHNGSRRAYGKAAKLFESQRSKHPEQGIVWCRTGEAEWRSNPDLLNQGENKIREGTRVGRDDYRCWLALGEHLVKRAILETRNADREPRSRVVVAWPVSVQLPVRDVGFLKNRTTPPDWLLREAKLCFDKAVLVGPRQAETYLARACFQTMMRGVFESLIIAGVPPEPGLECPKSEIRADLEKACHLTVGDFRVIGSVTLLLGMIGEKKGTLLEGLGMLEQTTARSRDKRSAAGAAEFLGFHHLFFAADPRRAATYYGQATKIDPRRDAAWDMLIAIWASLEEYDRAAKLCKERIQIRDSAHNRLLLASVFDRANKTAECREQIKLLLEAHPNDFRSNAAWAILQIKSTDAPRRGELLKKRLESLEKLAMGSAISAQLDELSVLRAVSMALNGERESARDLLRRLMRRPLGNDAAQEILKVLDGR